MLGNVYEWTGDFAGAYPGTVTDPTGPTTGSSTVFRGGSWIDIARGARAAFRIDDSAGDQGPIAGLRLARTAP
jgi:formylglycine-generating enzyme required for sulfatase activity